MTELLVGTRKGLFVLEGEPGSPFDVTARAFAGEPVEYAVRDPRSGRVLASVTSPFYGPKIWYTDAGSEWEQATGVALPEGGDAALERIWVIVPGEGDGLLYAGGDPGVLFESHDGGETWEQGPLGALDQPGLAARGRRPVPALDRDLAPGTRTAWRRRCPPWGSGSATTAARPGARATKAWLRARCPKTRRRRRSATAFIACTAPRPGPSGCSCSSTAASTAPTTPARPGSTSPPVFPRTSRFR
jgi:hypothetical protein